MNKELILKYEDEFDYCEPFINDLPTKLKVK